MKLMKYLEDKIYVIIINIVSMIMLSLYLTAIGNFYTNILLIIVAWIFILIVYFSVDFLLRRKYFNELTQLLNKLEKRYLIGEIHTKTPKNEDKIYHEIIRKSNKSVIEEIRHLEDIHNDYKEYIEAWIHDVKSPLTAIELICENSSNHHSNTMEKINTQVNLIENQVEKVLYFARSDDTYKDYIIHKINLKKVVLEVVKKNKLYFIQKNMQVQISMGDEEVSSDEKWIEFLLNQIFSNSIKYAKTEGGKLNIDSIHKENKLILSINDNGIGIPKNEISRIFEKGFTGSNGRNRKNSNQSTGIGLYLCKKLCDKLKIGITCESDGSSYTKIKLIFPDSNYTNLSKM